MVKRAIFSVLVVVVAAGLLFMPSGITQAKSSGKLGSFTVPDCGALVRVVNDPPSLHIGTYVELRHGDTVVDTLEDVEAEAYKVTEGVVPPSLAGETIDVYVIGRNSLKWSDIQRECPPLEPEPEPPVQPEPPKEEPPQEEPRVPRQTEPQQLDPEVLNTHAYCVGPAWLAEGDFLNRYIVIRDPNTGEVWAEGQSNPQSGELWSRTGAFLEIPNGISGEVVVEVVESGNVLFSGRYSVTGMGPDGCQGISEPKAEVETVCETCPPAVCLLAPNTYVVSYDTIVGLRVDGTEFIPQVYNSAEEAEQDGLVFVGYECSLCAAGLIRGDSSSEFEVFVAPGATRWDIASAIIAHFHEISWDEAYSRDGLAQQALAKYVESGYTAGYYSVAR